MLSVQIANSGMERLGVPTRTSLNSPTDDRGHISRRMRLVNRDITARDASCGLSDRQTRNINNNQHQNGCSFLSNSLNCNCKNSYNSDNSNQSTTKLKSSSSIGSSSNTTTSSSSSTTSKAAVTRICPHHVTLPDSECRYDRDLQIRAPYQQSEITRSFIKPPPNKCVSDVPKSYQFEQSNYLGLSCNLGPNNFYQQNNHFLNNQLPVIQPIQPQQPKSKPNVITKLFSRKSSSSSSGSSSNSSSSCPTNVTTYSTNSNNGTNSPKPPSPSLSSGSASSSSSSLCSAQTLPLTTTLTPTTNCNLGRKQLQNSNQSTNQIMATANDQHHLPSQQYQQHLTGMGNNTCTSLPAIVMANTSSSSMSTTSLTLTENQQFQQSIVGSTNSNNSLSSSSIMKSSSCNLSSTSSASMASLDDNNVAASSLSLPYSGPSIDCCYTQATNYTTSSASSLARKSNDKENNHRI